MAEVSAVLLSWRRPCHIPTIARHLRRFPEVTEIVIWQNEHTPPPEFNDVADQVHWSVENECTLGRFLGALKCRNDMVFVQDDDLLVHNIPQLCADSQRFGCDRVVANLADDKSSRHWTWWQVHRPPWCELGFGAVFPRAFAGALLDWPYDHELLRRKADKAFCILHPWHALRAGPDDITRLQHNGKESGRDEHALSGRTDHQRLTAEAVRLAAEWKASLAAGADLGGAGTRIVLPAGVAAGSGDRCGVR